MTDLQRTPPGCCRKAQTAASAPSASCCSGLTTWVCAASCGCRYGLSDSHPVRVLLHAVTLKCRQGVYIELAPAYLGSVLLDSVLISPWQPPGYAARLLGSVGLCRPYGIAAGNRAPVAVRDASWTVLVRSAPQHPPFSWGLGFKGLQETLTQHGRALGALELLHLSSCTITVTAK